MGWMGRDSSSSSSVTPPTTSSPSAAADSPVVRKKKITRTRTGCQTCRDRKVKCGEERPQCQNCIRTNHVCPGYAPATIFKAGKKLRQSPSTSEETTEHETTVTIVNSERAVSETNSVATLTIPSADFEDLKLFHYYTSDLAHTLSLPGALARAWSSGVPQLAFEGDHEFLIHALLAAAAAHKFTTDPTDTQSQRRGQEHYVQCLSLLQSIDMSSCKSHAAAALAAVMLLTWYESLYNNAENGIVHIRGAANIVRQHSDELLKTPTGRQLIHLFGRLELSASRHVLIDHDTASADANFWDKAAIEFDSLTLEEWGNGTHEWEFAWTEMMKIMVPITVLRMVPKTGNRGTQERKAQGEKIQEMLEMWRSSLPASFNPIHIPLENILTAENQEILLNLQPIFYGSLNVAVAMAHHAALQINVFTLTHRGDEPRPQFFHDAVERTFQICLGVQLMRQMGFFHVPDGGDFGILWPLVIAAIRAPKGPVRHWVLDLLAHWPRELMTEPRRSWIWLEAVWSRVDQGYGIEGVRNNEGLRNDDESQPGLNTIEITERCLEGENKGLLRTVKVTVKPGERTVVERSWHRGDMNLERVADFSPSVTRVLPP